MAIKIGSNIASMQAQRRLDAATSSLEKIYERLSSGQRINRASDDAAGLAISEDLNLKSRVFSQALRNGNDGISLLNIADSAIDNLSGISTRIIELAEQSANGTYSNKQREAIDKEAQALKAEFFRISKTTTFNGIRVFDGSLGSGLRLQLGFGVEGSINASVGGAIGNGSMGTSISFVAESSTSNAVALGDLNGDGILDLLIAGNSDSFDGYVTVRLGTANGSFGIATSFTTESGSSAALAIGDLNGDGNLDLVTAGILDGNGGSATVRLGTGTGSFGAATSYSTEGYRSKSVTLGDLNGDGVLDLITAGYSPGTDGYATIRLGTGSGTFGVARSYTTESKESNAVFVGDLNGDGILDLATAGRSDSFDGYVTVRFGSGSGNFGTATSFVSESANSRGLSFGDLNGDGILDLVTAGYSDAGVGYSTVRLGLGSGSFGVATSFTSESSSSTSVSLGDLNGDGFLDIVTAGIGYDGSYYNGFTTIRLGTGSGSFGAPTSSITESNASNAVILGDINRDGVLDLLTAGRSDSSDGFVSLFMGATKEGLAPLLSFSLKSKSDSLQALGMLQRSQENLSKQRGVIGAYQSRLNIAVNNLLGSKDSFSAAEARIRNVDIASEAANLIRTQILQQAAASVLAQANQEPQLVLKLLK